MKSGRTTVLQPDRRLARLGDGSLASIHLGFGRRTCLRIFERFFPHTTRFERDEDFIAQMTRDAAEWEA
jgi:hypothetical protein